MRKLREPGGCPWDREQTHSSIRRNMIEEVYEFLEAVDNHDFKGMEEELGDILMQVVSMRIWQLTQTCSLCRMLLME